ncbi:MAG: hypothetical protein ACTSXP_13810 [Promethearchaeota archaeon]
MHHYHDSKAALSYIFYLNDFSDILNDDLLSTADWKKIGNYLALDIVKYELGRLLLGFSTFSDYFRAIELIPDLEDHLTISMAHHPPSGGRHVKALRLIGVERIRRLFNELVAECRSLGLIKDKIWLWDGQLIKFWLQNE